MFKLAKKMFGKKPKEEKEQKIASFVNSVKSKGVAFQNFFIKWIKDGFDELCLMRKKMKNLLDTNMKLGFYHIEKGDIGDAIFRFKIIKFFWPDYLEGHYYLAYCYVLKSKNDKAKPILEELLLKDPRHEKSIELLKKINDDA